MFDTITQDDLIVAFYPCIYFSALSQMNFYLDSVNYRKKNHEQQIQLILERSQYRQDFYDRLIRFVGVCLKKKIKMIFENPYNLQHYLKSNFLKEPSIIDNNRMLRGDYFVKPTAYWFWNCEPTYGESYQQDKEAKQILKSKPSGQAGICSEDRSMISSDYARNFICDFILGKKQDFGQMDLF